MTTTASPTWVIMPAMSNPAMTEAAISDCLAQSVPVRILLVLQGVDAAFRDRFQQIAEQEPRLLVWDHNPSLPSLSATWNRALNFVWEVGGEEALVVNNDVRLHCETVRVLSYVRSVYDALFITAVGVTAEQYDPTVDLAEQVELRGAEKGGPDFSCFLISKAGHEKYPFDEKFTPAFCEDCSTHREYMLGGDGERIFSINLPYWHIGGGSNTLKSMSPEQRQKHEQRINQSRRYYESCWGGPPNQERFTIKGDPTTAQDGVTNPELQRAIQEAERVSAN